MQTRFVGAQRQRRPVTFESFITAAWQRLFDEKHAELLHRRRDLLQLLEAPALIGIHRQARIRTTLADRFDPRDRTVAVELDLQQRSEEHTSELQSLMRISYAVFCLKK